MASCLCGKRRIEGTEAELEAIRRSVARGQPYGNDAWRKQTASRIGARIDDAFPWTSLGPHDQVR